MSEHSKNIHIVVVRPDRAVVLEDDVIHTHDFSDPRILEYCAHLYGNPPILIDVTERWGVNLIRAMQALGYTNFCKMAPDELKREGWHE